MKKFFSAGLCLMLLVCSLAPMAACEKNTSGLPHDDQAKIEELFRRQIMKIFSSMISTDAMTASIP